VYSSSSCIYLCLVCISILYPLFFLSPFPLIFLFQDFMGISFTNPHETSLVHLGELRGLKGLVAYAKCNSDSCESELGSKVSFSFVLLEGKRKIGVGVFVRR